MTHEYMTQSNRSLGQVKALCDNTLQEINKLLEAGNFEELDNYGLEFNLEQERGEYFYWLLTFGGPTIEIRFYVTPLLKLNKATYFYSWEKAHEIEIDGADPLWDYFSNQAEVTVQKRRGEL